jgi:hypothetical protein
MQHVKAHPGCTIDELADGLKLDRDHVRKRVWQKMKLYGYYTGKSGGCFAPRKAPPRARPVILNSATDRHAENCIISSRCSSVRNEANMIDPEKETILQMAEAAALPFFTRRDRDGKLRPASVPKMHRLFRRGERGPGGERIKLESLKIAGTTVTTREACLRFVRAINGQPDGQPGQSGAAPRSTDASAFLDAAGIA